MKNDEKIIKSNDKILKYPTNNKIYKEASKKNQSEKNLKPKSKLIVNRDIKNIQKSKSRHTGLKSRSLSSLSILTYTKKLINNIQSKQERLIEQKKIKLSKDKEFQNQIQNIGINKKKLYDKTKILNAKSNSGKKLRNNNIVPKKVNSKINIETSLKISKSPEKKVIPFVKNASKTDNILLNQTEKPIKCSKSKKTEKITNCIFPNVKKLNQPKENKDKHSFSQKMTNDTSNTCININKFEKVKSEINGHYKSSDLLSFLSDIVKELVNNIQYTNSAININKYKTSINQFDCSNEQKINYKQFNSHIETNKLVAFQTSLSNEISNLNKTFKVSDCDDLSKMYVNTQKNSQFVMIDVNDDTNNSNHSEIEEESKNSNKSMFSQKFKTLTNFATSKNTEKFTTHSSLDNNSIKEINQKPLTESIIFCHSCGCKYLITSAKFCSNCGIRRCIAP
ncbi:uncharacterized protein MAL8P1.12-like [Daktulosphaira vitifoliae]|uniref:uncharacterized protein MAL8P1.12-like n=1 Tax=Daktulosphaira vitifoliae TaxID=58002 RepID=UPI0021A999B9|nr:uncharacterized protein MAL8P1.12-like [Daktulosphaira vitifoliae]